MRIKELLKNKKVIISFAVFVVIVIIFFVVHRRKKAEESDISITGGGTSSSTGGGTSSSTGGGISSSTGNATLPVASFPLTPYSQAGEYTAEAGSYGQQIANLQKICNRDFHKSLAVDGKYGPESEAAFSSAFGCLFGVTQKVYEGIIKVHGA